MVLEQVSPAATVTDFYGRFGPVSLTLLGLWLVAVQVRYESWIRSRVQRRRAAAVSLVFGLPGVMALVSLVDPTVPELWRIVFGTGGVLGALGVLGAAPLRSDGRQSSTVSVALWTAGSLFGAIAVVAAIAGVPALGRSQLSPLEIEAILLSALLLVGLVVTWLLLFEEPTTPSGER